MGPDHQKDQGMVRSLEHSPGKGEDLETGVRMNHADVKKPHKNLSSMTSGEPREGAAALCPFPIPCSVLLPH